MSETYNPRERTFIKMPEVKMCTHCGQPIAPDVKPMNNHMSIYVNDETKVEVAFNSNEPFVEIGGKKMRRKDFNPNTPKTMDTTILTDKSSVKPATPTPTK